MRFSRACLVALLLAFCSALGLRNRARRKPDDALAHFTADDFSETVTGIREVAAQRQIRAPKPSSAPCRTAS